MAVLLVPTDLTDPAATPWPSLGPQLADWIEAHLTFGPGDLLGEPAVVDAEKRALLTAIYQVFPQRHQLAGRRRFKAEVVELAKGLAKTEFAAWVAAAELHPEGPVRCDGFDAYGDPVGRGLRDPYIPMFAFTEEQTEELAYGALRKILEASAIARDFDVGLERITRADGTGKCEPLAGSPGSADGRRTTFQHFDEPHRMISTRLIKAHETSVQNIPKRIEADAHSLYTGTRHDPSEASVHRDLYETAEEIRAGKVSDPTFFFFSRSASRSHDVKTDAGLRAALEEASGGAAAWRDFRAIMANFRRPRADLAYLCRVWLNWSMKGGGKLFDADLIRSHVLGAEQAPPRDRRRKISLGFDGSRKRDATGLVATDLATGYQWLVKGWSRPSDADDDYEVPRSEVDAVVRETFAWFDVVAMEADPEWWDETLATWAGRYNRRGRRGGAIVREHYTNQDKRMGLEVRTYLNAIDNGQVKFADDDEFLSHFENVYKRETAFKVPPDEVTGEQSDEKLVVMAKERRGSPLLIDFAMAGLLSWCAHLRAIAEGHNKDPGGGAAHTW